MQISVGMQFKYLRLIILLLLRYLPCWKKKACFLEKVAFIHVPGLKDPDKEIWSFLSSFISGLA